VTSLIMIRGLTVCAAILFSSCTILSPLDKLYPFLTEEIPLEDLNETVFVVGPVDVYSRCIALGVNPLLVVLGAPLFGCAKLEYNRENNKQNCTIYMAFDAEWIYQHEHRHCVGYED